MGAHLYAHYNKDAQRINNNKSHAWTGEVLRGLAVLSEDISSVLRTHTGELTIAFYFQLHEIQDPLWFPEAPARQTLQQTRPNKLKISLRRAMLT